MSAPSDEQPIPGEIVLLPAGIQVANPPSYDDVLRDLGRAALAYDDLMQELAERSGYYAALAAVQTHPDHPTPDAPAAEGEAVDLP